MDSRRRQSQSHRPDAVAGEGRPHARRAQSSKARAVTGVIVERGSCRRRALSPRRRRGRDRCESLVNCAGQWAREFGKLAGVNVPLFSAEHFYIVTRPIEGVHADLPVMRDPDGFIYYKEEVGGLVMGGFEPVAKPWDVERLRSASNSSCWPRTGISSKS